MYMYVSSHMLHRHGPYLLGIPMVQAMHIAPHVHVKDEYPNVCIYMYTRILERAPLSLWMYSIHM